MSEPIDVGLAEARRIALAAQGFADKKPGSVDVRHFRRAMTRMSVLQIDSVNVLCRSHYLPVFARLGSYDRTRLDRYLYRSGEHYEFLSHEASIASQDLQPLLRYKTRSWSGLQGIVEEHPEYVESVFDQVGSRGPLSVSDLADPGNRSDRMWGWSKGKLALEALYVSGRISIAERNTSFLTFYDLPERVIRPEILALPTPDEADAKRAMVALALRSHGIGTVHDLADYFRLKVGETKLALSDLVAAGQARVARVPGWDAPTFVDAQAKRPRSLKGRALLSPFDPVVWFRPRAERLFDFRYRIEIYTPKSKRVYGYYVLPFLLDGELVARVDLKADRPSGSLLVQGAFAEESIRAGSKADRSRVVAELAESLADLAAWLNLDQGCRVAANGDLAQHLSRTLSA